MLYRAYRIIDGRYDNVVLFASNSSEARRLAWKSMKEADLSWVKSFVDFRVLRASEYDIYQEGGIWMQVSKYNNH